MAWYDCSKAVKELGFHQTPLDSTIKKLSRGSGPCWKGWFHQTPLDSTIKKALNWFKQEGYADHIVVLPLSSSLDTTNVGDIQTILLQGVQQYQVKVAILDLTALRLLDAPIATALLQAIQASQLLGASCIVTGMTPEIAQTVVHLGINLQRIHFSATLQEGFKQALMLIQRNQGSAVLQATA